MLDRFPARLSRGLAALWLLAAVALAACATSAGHEVRLTILHVNDLHARFLPDEEGRGGFAHLATAIAREKARAQNSIVLMAGDLVQGTPVSSIYEGVPCYEVASLLGIDVNTLGNHEFDYTWRKIAAFRRAATFPTISANVVNDKGELLAPPPYVILERGGLRVAVIGVLTEYLDRLTKSYQRGEWKTAPVLDTVRRYAQELRAKADLVVVVAHLTDEEEDLLLAAVPEIDVIVGGHNHRGRDAPKEVDGRLCVKVRAYGRELGRLDLWVGRNGERIRQYQWARIAITKDRFPPDPKVAAAVERWEKKVASLVDVPIARLPRALDRDDARRLIEEAMADAVGADIAYMNRGGIRDTLPAGEVTVRDVWQALPFGNEIVYGRVPGRDVPRPAARGVEPDRDYVLATNDFIYEQWRKRYPIELPERGPLVREALIDYLKRHPRYGLHRRGAPRGSRAK